MLCVYARKTDVLLAKTVFELNLKGINNWVNIVAKLGVVICDLEGVLSFSGTSENNAKFAIALAELITHVMIRVVIGPVIAQIAS